MDPFHHLPTLSPRGVYILTSLGPAATVLTLNSATGSRPRVSGIRDYKVTTMELSAIYFQTQEISSTRTFWKNADVSPLHPST